MSKRTVRTTGQSPSDQAGTPPDELDAVFKDVVMQSPISTWITDRSGTSILLNAACRKLFCIESDEQVVGKYNLLEDTELEQSGLLAEVKKVYDEGASLDVIIDFEPTCFRQLGVRHAERKSLRVFMFPITDASGDVQYAVVQHEDYTEKRGVEEALRAERDRAQKYLDVVNVMILVLNADQTVALINDKGCEVLGYPVEEIVGRNWFETFLPEGVRAHVKDVFDKLMAGEIELVEYYENPVLTRSGEERMIAWHNTLLRDDSGRIYAGLSSGEDITERVQAEASLRNREELLQTLITHAPAAIAMFDNEMRYLAFSRRWLTDYRLNDRSITGMSHYEVFPEIREMQEWIQFHQQALQGATLSREEDPFPRADGTVDWLRWEVLPWRRPDGSIGGIIMFTEVITERKRAETELKIFRYAAESSAVGIGIADADGTIIYMNPACAEMHGYPADELIGQNWEILFDDSSVARQVISAVLQSGRWMGESIGRRKDGSTFMREDLLSTIALPGEEPSGLLGMTRDITLEKRAEESRHRMETFLEEQQRQFFRQTILAATDGKLAICDPSEIEALDGKPLEDMTIRLAEDIGTVRHQIKSAAMIHGMEEKRAENLALCVGEAATNALKHAGGGTVTVLQRDRSMLVRVSDRGPGMDALILPRVIFERGYSTGSSLGMGYALILALADTVCLDTSPAGTTVVIEMDNSERSTVPLIEALPDTW